ncbi:PH domain-containing protein [Streptomyces radicis]|uniref:PH domain-containing protein n=1 Tax=Streptomyces radicis TaxID=1750517 RepID=A0A3A9W2Y0_9ACTN|nr:PH domain-containing protein [Streptomyces radicis]RKN07538.1 PH domain-containing protein [Streptomyces radicis]RKN13669.1 PH domain-containing protein [Streptomyces radicis]
MSERVKYADRIYRSGSAIVGGVMLLGLAGWLGGDAIVRGDGRAPVTAIAALLFVVPLVTAFTFRPAVFASDERLRVRNPFRTVTLPWATVDTIRAGYSTEVLAGDAKYQLWAIPVSLRARSKATRHNERAASGKPPRVGLLGFGGGSIGPQPDEGPRTAPGDVAVAELRELAERHHDEDYAQGTVTARWSYEILAPLAAGAIALTILWLTG